MSKKIRVGIVGCGSIANQHLSAYQNTAKADIVAVYDVVASAGEKFAERSGAQVVQSVEEMVEKYPLDAVSVCTPPAAHLENCLPFLEAGIAILCEKPLEVNAASATRLFAAVKNSKSLFMTAFCHRFHPGIIELKRLVEKGQLGEPLLFRNIFGGYLSLAGNHRTDPQISGGGCLIDHCCHSIDLFRFLVGDPMQAQAVAGNIMQELPIEDFGMIHLSVNRKSFGEITASYSLKVCRSTVEWYGTKGTAIVSYFDSDRPDLAYRLERDNEWSSVDCSGYPDRFTGEIEHFLSCVREQKAPSVTVEDGLKANQIAAAVYKSVVQGRQIEITYQR